MDSGRLETRPPGAAHLDTVRALHQTVVSLRTALEVSKNELKELKQKYQQHSHCLEYTDIIEKLSLENHILRRKIIDSGLEVKTPNIKLQVTYSPKQDVEDYQSELIIHTATSEAHSTDLNSSLESVEHEKQRVEEKNIEFCSTEILYELEEKSEERSQSPDVNISADVSPTNEDIKVATSTPKEDLALSPNEENIEEDIEDPHSQITSFTKLYSEDFQPSFKTKLELLSKFDVRIKVRTIKEGTIISSTTSDTNSTTDRDKDFDKGSDKTAYFQFEERREHFENTEDPKGNKINLKSVSSENIKMAVPNEADAKAKVDKFDVQVRITSEENLVVKEHLERSRKRDTLNLDVDDLSLRSMSEGDNSVFSEGGVTPADPRDPAEDKDDNGSGNESEEVDDIELIFTTDESKDMSNLQEDLVSIRESGDGDTWGPLTASTHSTPVLIKFNTLDPDFQPGGETGENAENENQENSTLQGGIPESLRIKRVSLPNDKEIRHVAFNGKGSLDIPGRGILKSCVNKSDNTLYRKSPNTSTRRLDSVDSLTCEYNRGLSFDNTKSSSFELGSSMDILHREESLDSFHKTAHLGHRFSVFAETDISKCGISEEDLAGNYARRNTCPNPFQYRPPPSRYPGRPSGPLRAGGSRRPVLREAGGPRRESAAQTDLCALPPRWGSDTYLAYKMSVPPTLAVPTLPTRGTSGQAGAGAGGRRPGAGELRPPPPARRTDETRRVMLSDIGFTSMVPELSRSADPVWALAKRAPSGEATPSSNSTAKFFSRGSFRSPCLSIDHSSDWTPQNVYVPFKTDNRLWRSSLPDVRYDDTDELLAEADSFVRHSIENLRSTSLHLDRPNVQMGEPYIPAEPKHLRLGHTVKVITPHGRVAVGRVRYVGIAGGNAASSSVVVGAEFPLGSHPPGGMGVGPSPLPLPRNDGTHRGRRYFLASPHCTALFVPFNKVVLAWAN